MMRADMTGRYMTHSYPEDLKLHIDPARFQTVVDNYRDTFQRKYKSPMCGQDSFTFCYEDLVDEPTFSTEILPKLWKFLGVNESYPLVKLRETVKQANPEEDLMTVIENYDELEFCFRLSNVLHFSNIRREDAAAHKEERIEKRHWHDTMGQ
eukprot:scaffold5296_cov163-Amphora_coffeaeformis.AAC.12